MTCRVDAWVVLKSTCWGFFAVVLLFKQPICIGSPEDTQFLTMISRVVFAITGTSL